MTDLHTHILPGMDDGARDADTSLAMLRMAGEQGVDTVVLTPHFYRDCENAAHFLSRRARAEEQLERRLEQEPPEARDRLPRMLRGAEVAWGPNLAAWRELPKLCIEGTRLLLLELPSTPWDDGMLGQLYGLPGKTGLMPVIAHLERYLKTQRRDQIREILGMGFPIQVSAETLLRPLMRRRALRMLREGSAHLIASDCHNTSSRPPNLGAAMEQAARHLDAAAYDRLQRAPESLLGLWPREYNTDLKTRGESR